MKYKGKVIGLSNLLTILGVVCFASIVVLAVVVTSNTLTYGGTTVTPASVVLTNTGDVTSISAGNLAEYHYNANTGSAITSVSATVEIDGTGILVSAVTNATVVINGNSVALTFSQGTDKITSTVSISDISAGATHAGIVWVKYATAGSYTLKLSISGTA